MAAGAVRRSCWPRGRSPSAPARHPSGDRPPGSPSTGTGSTYVGLAMQQWVADAQTQGLSVNYPPTGSPHGLTASTRTWPTSQAPKPSSRPCRPATISRLPVRARRGRRRRDHVQRQGHRRPQGRLPPPVAPHRREDLHRRRSPTGTMPRSLADNRTPSICPISAINVVYRSGQSGTTGLFYDFVAHAAPDIFQPWAARNALPDERSDHPARTVHPASPRRRKASTVRTRSLSTSRAPVARGASATTSSATRKTTTRRRRGSRTRTGEWVLPYAANISAALEDAASSGRTSARSSPASTTAPARWRTRSRLTATS